MLMVEAKSTFRDGRVPMPPLPNSFAGMMEMYEANYILIRKLCGDRKTMPAVAVSRVANCVDLHLRILAQTKYTTTIALTHYFPDGETCGRREYPDIRLKIYYDSLQVEVLPQFCYYRNRDFYSFDRDATSCLPQRWRMNRFLFKWLSWCDRQGHSFRTDRQCRATTVR